jgi:hypothetical protein
VHRRHRKRNILELTLSHGASRKDTVGINKQRLIALDLLPKVEA